MAINVGDFGSATATGSGNAGAATVNNNDGIVTTFSLTTAASGVFVLTLTNNNISANSLVMVEAWNGTNTSTGLTVNEVTPAAGSCTINVKNTNGSALNGTIKIGFSIV